MGTPGSDEARELYDYMDREYKNAKANAVRGLAQRQGDAEPYRDPDSYLYATSENVPHWGQKTLRCRPDGAAVSAATAAAVFGYMEVLNKYLFNPNLISDEKHKELMKAHPWAYKATQHQHDVSHPDKYGSTMPIHRAASSGHLECVRVLLRHGAILLD